MAQISAAADYALFTAAPSNSDPTLGVGQVMLELTNGQAKLIGTMRDHVAAVVASLNQINDLLNKVANGKAWPGVSDEANGSLVKSAVFTSSTPPGAAQLAARQSMIDVVKLMVHYGGTTAQAYTPNETGFNVGANIGINMIPTVPAQTGKAQYQIYAYKTALDNTGANLQRAADQVSAEAQQAQLDLQTMMGRYNGAFEVVTAAIKKSESRAKSVTANIRR